MVPRPISAAATRAPSGMAVVSSATTEQQQQNEHGLFFLESTERWFLNACSLDRPFRDFLRRAFVPTLGLEHRGEDTCLDTLFHFLHFMQLCRPADRSLWIPSKFSLSGLLPPCPAA